jgi:DNA-binding phage protein
MAGKKKTAFDRYFDERMEDPEFARDYTEARAEIDTIDVLIRMLDEVRIEREISKADLARCIGMKPEVVRRLFTVKSPNPTVSTLVKLVKALNMQLILVPGGSSIDAAG